MFKEGDKLLVLLPSSTHKLKAEWQGPYEIICKVEVDFELNVGGPRKKTNIFHINMLRQWHEAVNTSYLVGCVSPEDEVGEVPDDRRGCEEVIMGEHLTTTKQEDMIELITQYSDVVTSELGRTTVTEHKIWLTTTIPSRQ